MKPSISRAMVCNEFVLQSFLDRNSCITDSSFTGCVAHSELA